MGHSPPPIMRRGRGERVKPVVCLIKVESRIRDSVDTAVGTVSLVVCLFIHGRRNHTVGKKGLKL